MSTKDARISVRLTSEEKASLAKLARGNLSTTTTLARRFIRQGLIQEGALRKNARSFF